MDKAKPYGLGQDLNNIFAFLWACFGISTIDAQARLQRLQHDPHTPLKEHTTTVMKLVQIAYSDLAQADREQYTFHAFIQSINDLGLHHQFLTTGVTTVEGTLAEEEVYRLANQMHKNRRISRQVEVEPSSARDRRRGTANCCIEGRTADRHNGQAVSGVDTQNPGRHRL